MRYYLGIDLGGTNIAAGIVEESGALLKKASVPTLASRGAGPVCDDIARLAAQLAAEAGTALSRVAAVGIGSPGIVREGVVQYASNLQFQETPLQAMLEARVGLPVHLVNDGNAAAYGELAAGAGRGCSSLAALTIGTGIGGGLVLDGGVYSGFNGAAGELGHTVIVARGRTCSCGKRGCLEAYCSATSLKVITVEAMQANPESLLWEMCGGDAANVSAKSPFEAMRRGDKTGLAVVEDFLFHLGIGVSNVVNLLQPQVVCIGGGVSREGEAITLPLRRLVREQTYLTREKDRPQVVTAALGGDAGIIGAALLAALGCRPPVS